MQLITYTYGKVKYKYMPIQNLPSRRPNNQQNTHAHVFRCGDRLESNKGDLHRQNGSNDVQRGISNVHPMGEPPRHHQGKDVEGDDVNQEHVATP